MWNLYSFVTSLENVIIKFIIAEDEQREPLIPVMGMLLKFTPQEQQAAEAAILADEQQAKASALAALRIAEAEAEAAEKQRLPTMSQGSPTQ